MGSLTGALRNAVVLTSTKRVLVFGATGTAGQGVVRALFHAGHVVTCAVRREQPDLFDGSVCQVSIDLSSLPDHFKDQQFDVVVSCLASRTGTPRDAWAIDHQAHLEILKLAQLMGATQFILLSAICVQKPRLQFQYAKLAFEAALIASGMTYSIIRPTAFFKSLSGQIDRVRQGKAFLVFGDGTLTACKPISDDDLGRFIAGCIGDPARHNQILPIGGPGPAITPLDQGNALARLLGKPPKFRHVPLALLDGISCVLRAGGLVSARLRDKADLERIGRYYAAESMLVLDPQTGRYDADATPSFGSDTLFDYYAQVIAGDRHVQRGDHSVF
ncbi:NAD(P)H-binding protein [Pseudosulfitobacter koreensis]|uniref:Divinyl chlorophyllide a 8-vinyl-reductase, chloroplastic n=1 Tax=Pseudosulfitobacter koreensis TaxID=2968472 RepID=A0ABT1YWG0_9RHOB|nr:NAD(P)H-binding protein [Pseudosulfitobacter koreense]MCR8825207.1 NAD(P)H-binding protein [Pseudosulfitobacter koreense]